MLHIFSFSIQELLLSSNDLEDLLVSAKDNDSIRAKLTVSVAIIFHLYSLCSKLVIPKIKILSFTHSYVIFKLK